MLGVSDGMIFVRLEYVCRNYIQCSTQMIFVQMYNAGMTAGGKYGSTTMALQVNIRFKSMRIFSR